MDGRRDPSRARDARTQIGPVWRPRPAIHCLTLVGHDPLGDVPVVRPHRPDTCRPLCPVFRAVVSYKPLDAGSTRPTAWSMFDARACRMPQRAETKRHNQERNLFYRKELRNDDERADLAGPQPGPLIPYAAFARPAQKLLRSGNVPSVTVSSRQQPIVDLPPQWRPRCAGERPPHDLLMERLCAVRPGQELRKAIVKGPIIMVLPTDRPTSFTCQKRQLAIVRASATRSRMHCNASAASRWKRSIRPERPRRDLPLQASPHSEGRRRSAPRPKSCIADTTAPACHDWSGVHHPRGASSGGCARARIRSYARQKGQYLSTARMIRAYALAGHRRRARHSGQTEQIVASNRSVRWLIRAPGRPVAPAPHPGAGGRPRSSD